MKRRLVRRGHFVVPASASVRRRQAPLRRHHEGVGAEPDAYCVESLPLLRMGRPCPRVHGPHYASQQKCEDCTDRVLEADCRNTPCHLGRLLPKTGSVGNVHADQERAQYLPPATSGGNMRLHRVEGSRRGCETRTATSITILRKDVVWISVFPYAKYKCKNYELQTETCRSCAISSPAAPGSLAVTSPTI